jgi:hypothetical protein
MSHNEEVIAGVAPDAISAHGLIRNDGVYYAAFDDPNLVRGQLVYRAASAAQTRGWLRQGATIRTALARPAVGAVPTLFDRCAWCDQRFAPGAPTLTYAGRYLHEQACREAFDRFLAEAELERAQATLRLLEA